MTNVQMVYEVLAPRKLILVQAWYTSQEYKNELAKFVMPYWLNPWQGSNTVKHMRDYIAVMSAHYERLDEIKKEHSNADIALVLAGFGDHVVDDEKTDTHHKEHTNTCTAPLSMKHDRGLQDTLNELISFGRHYGIHLIILSRRHVYFPACMRDNIDQWLSHAKRDSPSQIIKKSVIYRPCIIGHAYLRKWSRWWNKRKTRTLYRRMFGALPPPDGIQFGQ